MKVVQLLEAHAGESGTHAGQHFLEVVAIHFHGLPARGSASAEIAERSNAERSFGFDHRGGSTRTGIDIQVHFGEVGFDSHVSQPLSTTTHRPEWGSRSEFLDRPPGPPESPPPPPATVATAPPPQRGPPYKNAHVTGSRASPSTVWERLVRKGPPEQP